MLCSPGFFKLWGEITHTTQPGTHEEPSTLPGNLTPTSCLPQVHWPGHCTAQAAGAKTKGSLACEEAGPAQPFHEAH